MARGRARPRRSRGGVAGLEFAVIAPVLMLLFVGTIDVSDLLLTNRRLGFAAGAVAEIASTTAARTQTQNELTSVQAWQASTAGFALFPAWTAQGAQGTFSVTVSNVTFTASPAGCTSNCAYTGQVTWSLANDLGSTHLRACGPVASAPNNQAPSFQTLPAGNFGATSVIVADLTYTFHPLFLGIVLGDIPLMQSAYVSPRTENDTLLVDDGGKGVYVLCPGVS